MAFSNDLIIFQSVDLEHVVQYKNSILPKQALLQIRIKHYDWFMNKADFFLR